MTDMSNMHHPCIITVAQPDADMSSVLTIMYYTDNLKQNCCDSVYVLLLHVTIATLITHG